MSHGCARDNVQHQQRSWGHIIGFILQNNNNHRFRINRFQFGTHSSTSHTDLLVVFDTASSNRIGTGGLVGQYIGGGLFGTRGTVVAGGRDWWHVLCIGYHVWDYHGIGNGHCGVGIASRTTSTATKSTPTTIVRVIIVAVRTCVAHHGFHFTESRHGDATRPWRTTPVNLNRSRFILSLSLSRARTRILNKIQLLEVSS